MLKWRRRGVWCIIIWLTKFIFIDDGDEVVIGLSLVIKDVLQLLGASDLPAHDSPPEDDDI